MKVYLDDKELFEITEFDIKMLEHDLLDPQAEIERRLEWVIKHKCAQSYERMRKEWIPKLIDREILPPKDESSFIATVIAQQDYKNRSTIEAEAKEAPGEVENVQIQ